MPITSSDKSGISGDNGHSRRREYEGPIFDLRPESQSTQLPLSYEDDQEEFISPYDPRIGMNLVAPMTDAEYEMKKNAREVQRKSAIPVSSPEDKEEKEADAIAKKISDGTEPEKFSGKGTTGGTLDKKTETGVKSLRGKGFPLPELARLEMEQKFGKDFGDVRIHTGSEAEMLSRKMNARAFTYGDDIAFNKGEYNPGSNEGKRLLAHELAHTVQQGAVGRKVQRQEEASYKQGKKSKDEYAEFLIEHSSAIWDYFTRAVALQQLALVKIRKINKNRTIGFENEYQYVFSKAKKLGKINDKFYELAENYKNMGWLGQFANQDKAKRIREDILTYYNLMKTLNLEIEPAINQLKSIESGNTDHEQK